MSAATIVPSAAAKICAWLASLRASAYSAAGVGMSSLVGGGPEGASAGGGGRGGGGERRVEVGAGGAGAAGGQLVADAGEQVLELAEDVLGGGGELDGAGEAVASEGGPGWSEGDLDKGATALVDVTESLYVVGGAGRELGAGGGDVAGADGDPGALGEGDGGAATWNRVSAVGVVEDDLGEGGRAARLVEVGADDAVADVGGAVGHGGLVDVAGGGEEDLGGVVGDGAGELLAKGGAGHVGLGGVGGAEEEAGGGDGGLDDDAAAPGVWGLAEAVAEEVLTQLLDRDGGGGVLISGDDVPVAGVEDGDSVEGGRRGAGVGGPGAAVPAVGDEVVVRDDGHDEDVAVGFADGSDVLGSGGGEGEGEGAPGGAVVGAGRGVYLCWDVVVYDEGPEGRACFGEGDEVGFGRDWECPGGPGAIVAADDGCGDARTVERGAGEAGADKGAVGGDDGGVALVVLGPGVPLGPALRPHPRPLVLVRDAEAAHGLRGPVGGGQGAGD